MMKRTISGMIGAGSLAHNRRDFVAENVDPDRVQLNICYKNENLKEVYKELFDDAVERYNVGKRKDREIANYYEDEVDNITKNLSSIIEPLMILIIGAAVGLMAVAIMMPMYNLAQQY